MSDSNGAAGAVGKADEPAAGKSDAPAAPVIDGIELPPPHPKWPPLVLRTKSGSGGYGTVYRARLGRRGPLLAVKAVPLVEEGDWLELTSQQPGSGASPAELVEHFGHWQRVIVQTAGDSLNNAALCEAAFYEMASDVARNTGAPWFVTFHGAFRVGSLDVATKARTKPASRRPRARTAFIKARRAEHRAIVKSFVSRVPAVLVCTDPCATTLGEWLRAGEAPVAWKTIRAMLAHAASAVLFLKSIGLTHNDFHLGNLMVTPTDRVDVAVSSGSTTWRLPTAGQLLQVVDYGLSTALCPRSPGTPKRKRPRLLNHSSLAGIRYRRHDPNVDMRTLLLDLATGCGQVTPAPPGADETARRADDPDYDAVCRAIELYARADDDTPDVRPWLLGLLDDRERLHAEVAEINAEDDEPNWHEDEVYGSLGDSMLAIRRIANCRHSSRRQRAIPTATVLETFFGAFKGPHRDDDRVVVLPPL